MRCLLSLTTLLTLLLIGCQSVEEPPEPAPSEESQPAEVQEPEPEPEPEAEEKVAEPEEPEAKERILRRRVRDEAGNDTGAMIAYKLLPDGTQVRYPAMDVPAPEPEETQPETTPEEKPDQAAAPEAPSLELVAESDNQWTGVTVSPGGRIFVNFPRWSLEVPVAVAELVDGELVPYPDADWNSFDTFENPGTLTSTGTPFVAVQSVYASADDFLYVLDTGNPRFQGVIRGAARLIRIDLKTDKVAQVIPLSADALPEDGYLNDLRVDTQREFAYITDSHASALIVVNLASTQARRVLDDHPSTASTLPEGIRIDGILWLDNDGQPQQVHADGIALSPDGERLYYQSLTGDKLFSVPTALLRDFDTPMETIEAAVQEVAQTMPSDGILLTPDGWLYLTAIGDNAIKRLHLSEGEIETVVQGSQIAWPDTLATTPDGEILFTTSQIHLGKKEKTAYKLFRINSL